MKSSTSGYLHFVQNSFPSNSVKFHSRMLFQTRVMPYNTGCGVEKSMDPSSRTREWTPSFLILGGLYDKAVLRAQPGRARIDISSNCMRKMSRARVGDAAACSFCAAVAGCSGRRTAIHASAPPTGQYVCDQSLPPPSALPSNQISRVDVKQFSPRANLISTR